MRAGQFVGRRSAINHFVIEPKDTRPECDDRDFGATTRRDRRNGGDYS
jgi:hypothetical protein